MPEPTSAAVARLIEVKAKPRPKILQWGINFYTTAVNLAKTLATLSRKAVR